MFIASEAQASLTTSIASALAQTTINTAVVASSFPAITGTVIPLFAVTATTSANTVPSAASPTATPSSTTADAAQCPWPGCWYSQFWAGPLMWMLLCYCAVSAFLIFALWCGGYLDCKLNLTDPYTSRRRPPRSMNEIWYYQQNQYRQRQRDRAAAGADPAAGNFEELQRGCAAAGIHVTTRELGDQLRYLEGALPALRSQEPRLHQNALDELRASERELQDAIIIANLRRQGLM